MSCIVVISPRCNLYEPNILVMYAFCSRKDMQDTTHSYHVE